MGSAKPPAKRSRMGAIDGIVDQAINRPRQPLTPGVLGPPSDVDYTHVLTGHSRRAVVSVTGLVAILLGFFLLYPGVSGVVAYLGWLGRGRSQAFTDYWVAALGFQYPEGLLAANLGLTSLIVFSMLLVRFVHQIPPEWLSSVQPGLRWRYMAIVFLLASVVMNTMYWTTQGHTEFHWAPPPNLWVWLLIIVLTSPLQAAGEEYLFRGYLMQVVGGLARNKWLAVLLSGAAFAAVHGVQSWSLLLDRFGFGVLMAVLVVVTGGLEAAIAAHAANNVFAFGYAAASGGVAQSRALTDVSWPVVMANLAAYAIVGVLAWVLARGMKAATKTP